MGTRRRCFSGTTLAGLAAIVAMVLVIGGWWLTRPSSPAPAPGSVSASPANRTATATVPLPGDALLQDYGRPGGSAEEDLARLGQVLANFRLLHKTLDARFLATNADLAATLRGETPGTTPLVSAEAPVFDAAGRLVDRWGTPIVVHPLSAEAIELRSAGPDRQAWNEDDFVRLPNGHVARGDNIGSMAP